MSDPDTDRERRRAPVAVILAGGSSTRMGTPKALLTAPGSTESFLDHLIACFSPHCAAVVVVLGHGAPSIESGARRKAEAAFVVNGDFERGQLSSLQCGLRAIPSDAGGAIFTPVDHASIRPATVEAVVSAFRRTDAPVVAPRHAGKSGHPVCCSPQVVSELLALPDGAQARDVIRGHRDRTYYVDVDDPGVTHDIDDPEAYARALGTVRP